jgi:hypothetical protein
VFWYRVRTTPDAETHGLSRTSMLGRRLRSRREGEVATRERHVRVRMINVELLEAKSEDEERQRPQEESEPGGKSEEGGDRRVGGARWSAQLSAKEGEENERKKDLFER